MCNQYLYHIIIIKLQILPRIYSRNSSGIYEYADFWGYI